MSHRLTIEDRKLRLCARESGGYWVRLETTGRTLGVVYLDRSRWVWESWPGAYRGDGREGHETDGCPSDVVPAALVIAGRAQTRINACRRLVWFLDEHKAPALGYGRHRQVLPREAVDA
jgi:hypothetical protein